MASGQEEVDLSHIAILAFLGIVVYVPAYLVQHRIVLSAGPAYASLLGLGTPPLVGVASAMLGTSEAPGLIQTIGIALTMLGMVFVVRHKITAGVLHR